MLPGNSTFIAKVSGICFRSFLNCPSSCQINRSFLYGVCNARHLLELPGNSTFIAKMSGIYFRSFLNCPSSCQINRSFLYGVCNARHFLEFLYSIKIMFGFCLAFVCTMHTLAVHIKLFYECFILFYGSLFSVSRCRERGKGF